MFDNQRAGPTAAFRSARSQGISTLFNNQFSSGAYLLTKCGPLIVVVVVVVVVTWCWLRGMEERFNPCSQCGTDCVTTARGWESILLSIVSLDECRLSLL